jgi:hypothetical protein
MNFSYKFLPFLQIQQSCHHPYDASDEENHTVAQDLGLTKKSGFVIASRRRSNPEY